MFPLPKNASSTDNSASRTPASLGSISRFGHLGKISLSYMVIIAIGLTTFYIAKKDVDKNRQRNMKIRQEIEASTRKYPSRQELIEAEKLSKIN